MIDRSSTQLDGGFYHFQQFIDALIQANTTLTDRQRFIDICKTEYKDNPANLAQIKLFEDSYTREDALRWYTKPSFFSILLNKALRVRNIDFLSLFGFFIKDIHDQLTQLQRE
jgi:hypothetical protein